MPSLASMRRSTISCAVPASHWSPFYTHTHTHAHMFFFWFTHTHPHTHTPRYTHILHFYPIYTFTLHTFLYIFGSVRYSGRYCHAAIPLHLTPATRTTHPQFPHATHVYCQPLFSSRFMRLVYAVCITACYTPHGCMRLRTTPLVLLLVPSYAHARTFGSGWFHTDVQFMTPRTAFTLVLRAYLLPVAWVRAPHLVGTGLPLPFHCCMQPHFTPTTRSHCHTCWFAEHGIYTPLLPLTRLRLPPHTHPSLPRSCSTYRLRYCLRATRLRYCADAYCSSFCWHTHWHPFGIAHANITPPVVYVVLPHYHIGFYHHGSPLFYSWFFPLPVLGSLHYPFHYTDSTYLPAQYGCLHLWTIICSISLRFFTFCGLPFCTCATPHVPDSRSSTFRLCSTYGSPRGWLGLPQHGCSIGSVLPSSPMFY